MTRAQTLVLAGLLLPFSAYRVQRIVTVDSWPPTRALRRWVKSKVTTGVRRQGELVFTGEVNPRWDALYDFLTCPWCAGSLITFAVVGATDLWMRLWTGAGLPLPVLWMLAVATVVGKLGERDELHD